MSGMILRKIDKLVLSEFIPFFIMGVMGFTLLMVAVIQFKQMLNYVTNYGLSLEQVGFFFILALPQTVAYTFPMAVLFAALLSFGRLSDNGQITALRAGGIGFFRIVLPALIFAWFIVLATFSLNEKVAPRSTLRAKQYIQHVLTERGINVKTDNISYMDQAAGWLFGAASGEGNNFKDVKWWDFSRPGGITIYTADEGTWESDKWIFQNAKVIHILMNDGRSTENTSSESGLQRAASEGNVVRSLISPTLEMQITRTPTDILAEANRDPEEMSLQEIRVFLDSDKAKDYTKSKLRKIEGTYYLKIAAPFASIVFTLLAAPLGLTPQRSTGTMGVGLSMLLVFGYYMMSTFSVKIAEGGILSPILSAWMPNILFLIAGAFLNARFYMKNP
ncbi:MAG: LptF/LptG family permease [bacterium]